MKHVRMNLKKLSNNIHRQLKNTYKKINYITCRQTNGPCHPGLKKAEQSLEDQIYSILRKRRIISNMW